MNSREERDASGSGQVVAVIGAGASGTLTAAQLLRRGEPGSRVVLIERSGAFGPGVAYGSTSDAHRLNVAAAQMAPLPKDPQSFFRWSHGRDGQTDPHDFLPRRLFGEYLVDLLDHCERQATGVVSLERREDEVVALTEAPDDARRRRLLLLSGTHLDVDQVVLALGNSSPAAPAGLPPEIAASEHFIADPWEPGASATGRSDQVVLLLGTGLTMVDVALELGVGGGPVMYAISRSGMLPRAHQAHSAAGPPALGKPVPEGLDELVALLTDEVEAAQERGEDWRPLVDSLRPVANQFWEGLSPDEQARFHREHARLWSVHRHRMAPQVGSALHRLIEKGRLRVRSATLEAAVIRDGRVDVDISAGGDRDPVRFRVDRIINCTGPLHDPNRIDAPLVQDLVKRGSVRSNALGAGFDTDPAGLILDRAGSGVDGVYAIGPMRAGGLFETTAVPEIGQQARALATEITGNGGLRPKGRTRPSIRA